MAKKSRLSKGMIIGIVLIVSILIFLAMEFAFFSPSNQAKEMVDEFYRYEVDGDFANSWNLFHSAMKEKFTKGNYIQDRAHVFMNHFGVESFTYTIGKPEEMKKWKMSKTGPLLKNVYTVPVTQTYKGKYGNFDLKQEVFVVKEKGEWRIMWDYNQ
ncbi:hypothetical protein J7E79_25905 [Bacillus sp. ISL-40]|uniref:hypothetical protein n=1 Tax=unclassified Bacillus (in: firmicutes) TaxID=185979 RepID=UPI001BE883F7|nr:MULTISPECIES: hypothetical protein [unclassified Bacillus (in: firmicutes)]MBT2700770.1 hypothetical protein [Bacillus sp. ISL-40]MBT2719623.1 hypothetical protein [Bacillus sp. ISL-46]MBT2743587.1 hypothetical protein [Bacillus sp. ISL-77]